MTPHKQRIKDIARWKSEGFGPRQDDQDWLVSRLGVLQKLADARLNVLRSLVYGNVVASDYIVEAKCLVDLADDLE